MTIDWGDGSATETNSGTSATIYSHTYAATGYYTITISVSSGTMTLCGYVLGGEIAGGLGTKWWSTESLYEAHIGDNVTLENKAFHGCFHLTRITLPSSVTYATNASLFEDNKLKSITLPKPYGTTGVAGFNRSALESVCMSKQDNILSSWSSLAMRHLERFCIPVSFNGNQGMNGCMALRRFILAGTQIYTQALAEFYCLETLTIPATITKIDNNAAINTRAIKSVHMLGTTPPTLGGTSVFTNRPADFVIYVPRSENQSVLNSYKTASNWSTFADYMQEEAQ